MVSKGEMWVFTRTASRSHIVKSGQAHIGLITAFCTVGTQPIYTPGFRGRQISFLVQRNNKCNLRMTF